MMAVVFFDVVVVVFFVLLMVMFYVDLLVMMFMMGLWQMNSDVDTAEGRHTID